MRKSPYYRNQKGLATWAKVLLCIFALGLLVAIVGSICFVSCIKDMTDPLKTQALANKIVSLTDPLPPPFEYGRMNISMFGVSGALINNTSTGSLFFVIKYPTKNGENAKIRMEKVGKGEVGLPDPQSLAQGNDGSAGKSNMNVQETGEIQCGGKTLYFVRGRSVIKQMPPPGSPEGSKPTAAEVATFFGGADSRDPQYQTLIMGQQQDPSKDLTMEEVKNFLGVIKEI